MSTTSERVADTPPDILAFISMEHEQVLRTLRIDPEDMHFVDHMQGLYAAAMSHIRPKQLPDLVVFQLLTFTHYHFLFSVACFMRCHLIERHDLCSQFASHADADVFAHRSRLITEDNNPDAYATVEYFQFARDKTERRMQFLWLLNTFAVILSTFESFLHDEQKVVPDAWAKELQGLGARTESVRDQLSPSA